MPENPKNHYSDKKKKQIAIDSIINRFGHYDCFYGERDRGVDFFAWSKLHYPFLTDEEIKYALFKAQYYAIK